MSSNFHELLGRINGIATVDFLGTLVIIYLFVQYVNKKQDKRVALLYFYSFFGFFYLALLVHLALDIKTPGTEFIYK